MYGLSLLLLLAAGSWCDAQLQPVITAVTDPVRHGEGPHWDAENQVLYFVDIQQQRVNRYDPATGNVTFATISEGEVSIVIPVANAQNEFVVTAGRSLYLMTWDGVSETPQSMQTITSVESDKTSNIFNDGKADPVGRLWVGTIGPMGAGGSNSSQASLYMVDTNSNVAVTEITPVSNSNGLAWTADNKTFYYIDSPTGQIAAYDFDLETATITNKRVAFDFATYNISGAPDGMTIDTDDNLWIAAMEGGKILHVDPTSGTLLAEVNMPVTFVTSVVFGGENLETLYATSSQATEPQSGSTFAITGLGVKGTLSRTVVRNV